MSEVATFIQSRNIDSFLKLHLLMFLFHNPGTGWTAQQLAERLYIGDVPLLEYILGDLQAAGLLDCDGRACRARDQADLQACVGCLTTVCENPVARQEILDTVTQYRFAARRYQERAHRAS